MWSFAWTHQYITPTKLVLDKGMSLVHIDVDYDKIIVVRNNSSKEVVNLWLCKCLESWKYWKKVSHKISYSDSNVDFPKLIFESCEKLYFNPCALTLCLFLFFYLLNMYPCAFRLISHSGRILIQNINIIIQEHTLENVICKMVTILFRLWCVTPICTGSRISSPLGVASGPFHEQFFCHNSNLLEISLCLHPRCSEVVTMKFCTCHDSTAVMACAKFCSDIIPSSGVTLKSTFHWIWITLEKSHSWYGPLVIISPDVHHTIGSFLSSLWVDFSNLCFSFSWNEM